jgi:hypothetical protein
VTEDPNNPVILMSASSEMEAAPIVSALREEGIEVTTTGDLTSGFRAYAPGEVQLIVRQRDLEQARAAVERFEQNDASVDWSQVDVGEPEDD